jgi:hypothetical protein
MDIKEIGCEYLDLGQFLMYRIISREENCGVVTNGASNFLWGPGRGESPKP